MQAASLCSASRSRQGFLAQALRPCSRCPQPTQPRPTSDLASRDRCVRRCCFWGRAPLPSLPPLVQALRSAFSSGPGAWKRSANLLGCSRDLPPPAAAPSVPVAPPSLTAPSNPAQVHDGRAAGRRCREGCQDGAGTDDSRGGGPQGHGAHAARVSCCPGRWIPCQAPLRSPCRPRRTASPCRSEIAQCAGLAFTCEWRCCRRCVPVQRLHCVLHLSGPHEPCPPAAVVKKGGAVVTVTGGHGFVIKKLTSGTLRCAAQLCPSVLRCRRGVPPPVGCFDDCPLAPPPPCAADGKTSWSAPYFIKVRFQHEGTWRMCAPSARTSMQRARSPEPCAALRPGRAGPVGGPGPHAGLFGSR